ncbi:ATP-grasp domain-containing protein [Butyrivibrio fibrisolvens]|uniref:ATP-grasp domain-containing protein n=1 Tax=Butyrivibrio fibrisolvens TaxID=831 RepID=UPI0003B54D54|nr:ATP-grasp domain-containing protein [Butyrivibrio fibrisolvens]
MEKVLVFPGGKWQLPLVRRIKELGLFTVVVSPEENAPCKNASDFFCQSDIFDIDNIERLAKDMGVTAIVSDECDIAMPVVAELGKRLALRTLTPKEAKLFTNKYMMRDFCVKHGIPVPEYRLCYTFDDAWDFFKEINKTIIIKPVDSNASHGVFVINDEDELRKKFNESMKYSRAEKAIIAERYLQGKEFTADGLKTKHGHCTLAVSKKKHFSHNSSIAKELYFTYDDPDYKYDEIRKLTDKFVLESGLEFGLTHAEYKCEDGKYYLIEIAARGGGNLVSSVITHYLSGINTYDHLIKTAIWGDTEANLILAPGFEERCAALVFFETPREGIVSQIYGEEYLKNNELIRDYCFNFAIGDHITDCVNDSVRIGYYIACAKSKYELDNLIHNVEKEVRIEVLDD